TVLDAGLIPEGALQLVTGPVQLTDCFTTQDLISFTGTRATARQLRHQVAELTVEPRTRFATEAMNCAILAPDAPAGSAVFELFIARLVAAMTAHAGQSAAAVRRVFVPGHLLDDVVQAAAAALGDV